MKTLVTALGLLAGLFAGMGAWAQDTAGAQPGRVGIEVGMLALSATRAGGGEAWFTKEIAAFEEAHPDIDVTTLAIASPQKLERNIVNMPTLARNVVGVNSWQGCEAAWLASRGHIVPIDNFLPDPDLSLDVFPANLFDAVTFGGKIWAVPWCTDHLVLACNWPLFEEAGIDRPPETWAEFFAYAQQLTKDTNGDGQTDQWGVSAASYHDNIGFVVVTLMIQKDGHLFTKTGIDLSSPLLHEVFVTVQQWMDSGVFSKGMDADKNWGMGFVKQELVNDLDQNCRLALLPTWGRKVVCNDGTDYLAIRKSTPEEEKASWEFVKWISRKDVSMPEEWSGYPCRIDFVGRKDFKAIADNFGGTLALIYTQNALMQDPGPPNLVNRNQALRLAARYLGRAMAGEGNYESLMTIATQEANQLIEVIPDPADAAVNLYK
ncbi:MAG: extracellular solute-binding protein [Candidatus Hydrogenedentes bacterium]|nr:extracellular solute-binding protein [Candidatus Hydrogenedentota bacterium]